MARARRHTCASVTGWEVSTRNTGPTPTGYAAGATDSRHFDGVADNIYKFSPVRARSEDLKRFHGTNERISTTNYVELIQFWHQLIRNSAPAP